MMTMCDDDSTNPVRKSLESFFDTVCDNYCSICLGKCVDNDGFVLQCKHMFHQECIEKWEGCNKYTCPLCREPFYSKILIRIHKLYDILASEFAHDKIEAYVLEHVDYHDSYSNYDIYDALYTLSVR